MYLHCFAVRQGRPHTPLKSPEKIAEYKFNRNITKSNVQSTLCTFPLAFFGSMAYFPLERNVQSIEVGGGISIFFAEKKERKKKKN